MTRARAGVSTAGTTARLLATPAPYWELAWSMPPELVALCDTVPDDPVAGLQAVRAAMAWFAQDPAAAALGDPSPADAAVRERPGVADALVAMTVEGARQGAEGVAFDVVAGSLRDPLPLADLDLPVHVFGGDADHNVGVEHVDWWAQRIAHAQRHVVPGAGHLLAVSAWAEILDAAIVR